METEARWNDLALANIRVIDLTSIWAGPLCTEVLVDLGAEVVKIESAKRPDGTRNDPGFFAWMNCNKLGVTLNLDLPKARDCLKRLVAVSDIVVENFSPRVMRNFQLHYPVLKEIKPDLIMLSMPAYGSSGPYENYLAYGPGLEASSGLASLTGYRDGVPMLSGSAYSDPVAGLHGVLAILAALRYRRRTGKGQWIDLSQREALSQMFGESLVMAAKGQSAPRLGNRDPMMSPHGCYRCRGTDRWIVIAIRSDEEWLKLCGVMSRDPLTWDPRFANVGVRKKNEDELDREIGAWTATMESGAAVALLRRAGLVAGIVADARDLARDPHLAARGFYDQIIDWEGNAYQIPGLPWKSARAASGTLRRAPQLGEHNQQVLGGLLGLKDAEIKEIQ